MAFEGPFQPKLLFNPMLYRCKCKTYNSCWVIWPSALLPSPQTRHYTYQEYLPTKCHSSWLLAVISGLQDRGNNTHLPYWWSGGSEIPGGKTCEKNQGLGMRTGHRRHKECHWKQNKPTNKKKPNTMLLGTWMMKTTLQKMPDPSLLSDEDLHLSAS